MTQQPKFREMSGWATYNGMTRVEAVHNDGHTQEEVEAYFRSKYPNAASIRVDRCIIYGFSAYEVHIYN